MKTFLLIDAGQTSVKYEKWLDGERISQGAEGPVFTNRPLGPQFLELLSLLVDQSEAVGELIISTTGVTDPAAIAREIQGGLPDVEKVTVVHDSIGALVVNSGTLGGVVCAAGTGIVTFALSTTASARVDGWGHSMGDFGSGFWIGKAGMEAAMQSFDGRGPKTGLLAELEGRYGPAPTAYIAVQEDPAWVRQVASFAQTVLDMAKSDEVSRKIVSRAAAEIALSVKTAILRSKIQIDSEVPIALCGALFSSDFLLQEVKSRIRESCPDATFLAPSDHLGRLMELASLSKSHPLHEYLGVS